MRSSQSAASTDHREGRKDSHLHCHRRHSTRGGRGTSDFLFAVLVPVLPTPISQVDVNVNEKDLKIEVFRAGGAGGQHVNKTESAVRITRIYSSVSLSLSLCFRGTVLTSVAFAVIVTVALTVAGL
jgi:hypothetical protein